ncbi:NAD(P)H-hydrate dehydratase [Puniceicoccaceae bacterium K14]|nr:NAD(P)H-hydrate dehydratase [Puniceicoccaceae bacterium K14]
MSGVLPHPLPRDFSAFAASHPILTSAEAAEWENRLLSSDKDSWEAMKKVGVQLAKESLVEFGFGSHGGGSLRILGLIGKGHNGGDALLAIDELVKQNCICSVCLIVVPAICELKVNTIRAYENLKETCVEIDFNLMELNGDWREEVSQILSTRDFDITLDGLLGMSFRPPLRESILELIQTVNEAENLGLRVGVDLPSGMGEECKGEVFRCDVSFATGIAKQSLIEGKNEQGVGHVRYLDVGFFDENPKSQYRVLTPKILKPLGDRRPSNSEKRRHGHLMILAGSVTMPGALLMSVQAAVSSGVGLVTVFAPESVCPHLSAIVPEAMWVSWPETPDGFLALEGEYLIRRYSKKATALLVGPGIGMCDETSTLVASIVSYWHTPILLDADALNREVMRTVKKRKAADIVLTPHLGEFLRISEMKTSEVTNEDIMKFAESMGVVLALKGMNMKVFSENHVFVNTTGNSVLSRGGSGDVLSGISGSLLAQFPDNPLEVACMGAFWHGAAADLLAHEKGQVAVRTTELINYLAAALTKKMP